MDNTHDCTVNHLSKHIVAEEMEQRSPTLSPPPFVLPWDSIGTLWVFIVIKKSI